MATANGTQFQVATDTGFATKLIDYSGVYKASHDVPTGTLTRGVQLYARVRHSSVETGYGSWSPTRQFSVRPFVGFVSLQSGGLYRTRVGAIFVDTAGNIYTCGVDSNRVSTKSDTVLYKFSSEGVLLLKKRIYDATNTYQVVTNSAILVDGSNNSYTFGGITGPATRPEIVKLSNTGSLLWKKPLNFAAYGGIAWNDSAATGAKMDSVGWVYMVGWAQHYNTDLSTRFIDSFIMKLDSGGTPSWTKQVKSSASTILELRLLALSIAANGNIYYIGYLKYTTGIANMILVKCDPTGTSYWIQQFYSTTTENGINITTDTSSNIYFTATGGRVLKSNADGTLIWSKAITFPGYTEVYWNSVHYSDSYIYLIGQVTSDKQGGIVAKLDLNGNLIWAAVLTSTTYPVVFFNCTKLLNGQLTVVGAQARSSIDRGLLATISTDADNCTGILPNLTDLSWSMLTGGVVSDVTRNIITPAVTWYSTAPTTYTGDPALTIEDQTGLTVLSSQY